MITIQVESADQQNDPPILPVDRQWLLNNIRSAGGRLEPVSTDPDTTDAGTSTRSSTKGAVDLFSLFLPATTLPAVAQIIKIWLRERGRAITFEVTHDDETTTYKLTGATSDATVREVLTQAISHNTAEAKDQSQPGAER